MHWAFLSGRIMWYGTEEAEHSWPSLPVCRWLWVCVRACMCRWAWGIWTLWWEHTANFCWPRTSWVHVPAPPHPRFASSPPTSCRLSLVIIGRLISSDWQPCSRLALQSWCPGVSASRKAMAEVPLWLSQSFSQYPAPADRGWKVPMTALNYELNSAPDIYTTQHREPFPAEMPPAADYWGNISWTATRAVMVCRQSTWRSFCPQRCDRYERRGIDLWWNCPFYHTVVKKVRWFLMRTTIITFHTKPRP